ncbi:FabD/lysophospholipase-like protein, partial [Delitschia confertaspora ATCC 74209]
DFPPQALLEEFYTKPSQRAIEKYSSRSDDHCLFMRGIRREMETMFADFESRSDLGALHLHTEKLKSLWPRFSFFKSSKSCFACLMFMPEKVFDCGHAICNTCVRRFGRKSGTEKHSFLLPSCPLCGQSHSNVIFRLIPPTAGIRVLCLDGGGIRGVVSLTFLQHFERELYNLGCPLREFFDYVCGTSAGGFIAIGVFLMGWTLQECLFRFEDLATKTFMVEQKQKLSITQHIQRLLGAYVRDHRYDSAAIENAFRVEGRAYPRMFNPLQNDTKVAVTTTTARHNIPCVLSNYNGGQRSEGSIYHHVRADTQNHDISLSDAAVCSSAAPFFFKAKDLDNLDTYQDGGLEHNNPAFIASWECSFIWPEK